MKRYRDKKAGQIKGACAAVFLADDLFALGALPWWSLAVALLAAALIGEGIAFAKRIKEDTWNLSFET